MIIYNVSLLDNSLYIKVETTTRYITPEIVCNSNLSVGQGIYLPHYGVLQWWKSGTVHCHQIKATRTNSQEVPSTAWFVSVLYPHSSDCYH